MEMPPPGFDLALYSVVSKMVSGQHFRLSIGTFGIEIIADDNRVAVMVPAGEIITVILGPRPETTRLVDVQWGQKKLVMFVEDIQTRGELVKGEWA